MQPRRCRRYAILRTDSGDFADQVTHWAELQRDLVDNMGSWAARVRRQPRLQARPLPAPARRGS